MRFLSMQTDSAGTCHAMSFPGYGRAADYHNNNPRTPLLASVKPFPHDSLHYIIMLLRLDTLSFSKDDMSVEGSTLAS